MSLRPIPFSARIALAGLALAFACTLLAPWIAPHGEEEIVGGVWDLPSWSAGGSAFLLGTDNLGRDLLSRLIFGARTTILVAGGATLLSFSLGIVLSFTASVMRGWTDQLLSRFNDLMMAIPTLIFALVVLAVLPQTLWILVLVMAILDSTRVFRLGRAVATDIAVMDFVEAARLRGEGTLWIIFREILPNALSPLLAEFGLRFAFAVLFLSTLSFLGLGIQPPAADWGGMVKDNKDGLIFGVSAALYPGLAIASLAVCVNLVVDWLLNRTASLKGGAGMNAGAELLRVRGLCIGARVAPPGEAARDVSIVENVSFDLAKGRVLGLIGESGAGKSTIGLSVLGYGRGTVRITGGSMRLGGTELVGLNARGLRRVRGAKVAYVAQSAAAAFNPAFRLGHQVIEASLKHGLLSREAARGRAVELFRTLGLPQPESFGARYPHQVSGGQLQRAMTAMALLPAPDLIVFDEPTTALDVTTQIDVLVAIKRAIEDTHTAAIYVTHDLAVVAQVADDIMVLRHGRTVEYGTARQILEAPRERLHAAARRHAPSRQGGGGQARSAADGRACRGGVPVRPDRSPRRVAASRARAPAAALRTLKLIEF